ncbi:hypothetical protein POSPLADRAFT_1063401 [Postia placenta MAD-698-R-SB12]|uniref:Uncharacterized protein n=1 Tax=Postia placenta MAD-698-R-SB12 TaxID=670580 RepID=A0A1X6MHH0_9APHY|nr:hypothetical protein POSPLADRAFT_1063401 [Postia placenta MAD-698-R-SB12]OSX55864.1 hypothetical protein POSPLADRAFT_1063401 [Postia placenta MAD-698-R-SB12]
MSAPGYRTQRWRQAPSSSERSATSRLASISVASIDVTARCSLPRGVRPVSQRAVTHRRTGVRSSIALTQTPELEWHGAASHLQALAAFAYGAPRTSSAPASCPLTSHAHGLRDPVAGTKIKCSAQAHIWMKPPVRGTPAEPVELPGNWLIKRPRTRTASARDVEQPWTHTFTYLYGCVARPTRFPPHALPASPAGCDAAAEVYRRTRSPAGLCDAGTLHRRAVWPPVPVRALAPSLCCANLTGLTRSCASMDPASHSLFARLAGPSSRAADARVSRRCLVKTVRKQLVYDLSTLALPPPAFTRANAFFSSQVSLQPTPHTRPHPHLLSTHALHRDIFTARSRCIISLPLRLVS